MPRLGILFVLSGLCLFCGCCPTAAPRTADEQAMFGEVSFRIHPTFTQVKDWTGDNKPDGIEAVIECQDQFGDPTRAAGKVRFELYTFHGSEPDHRGDRLAIWSATLDARNDQIQHWDPAARGYSFQLAFEKIQTDHSYVLTAQFDRNNSRLFDQLIIEPSAKAGFKGDRRTQRATNAPGHNF